MGANQPNIQSTTLRPEGREVILEPISDLEIQILWHLWMAAHAEDRALHAYELCELIGGPVSPVLSATNGLCHRGLVVSRLYMVHLTTDGIKALLSLIAAGELRRLNELGLISYDLAGSAPHVAGNGAEHRASASSDSPSPHPSNSGTGAALRLGQQSPGIHLVNPEREPLLKSASDHCQTCDVLTARKCRECGEPTCTRHLYSLGEDEQPELCGTCLDVIRANGDTGSYRDPAEGVTFA